MSKTMARNSATDVVEKFRFRVRVFENFKPFDFKNVSLNSLNTGEVAAGFSEVVLPTGTITEIIYRENIDNTRFIKKPGLIRYDPVTLRKGVTGSTDLYNWFKQVHNDASSLTMATEVLGSLNVPISAPVDFRKDMLITSLDREGNAVKSWFLYNCFPVAYKGGNDFSSNAEEKLIAELSVTFESLIEVYGDDIKAATEEGNQAVLSSSLFAAAGFAITGGKSGGIL
jgi:phage tail-like protein